MAGTAVLASAAWRIRCGRTPVSWTGVGRWAAAGIVAAFSGPGTALTNAIADAAGRRINGRGMRLKILADSNENLRSGALSARSALAHDSCPAAGTTAGSGARMRHGVRAPAPPTGGHRARWALGSAIFIPCGPGSPPGSARLAGHCAGYGRRSLKNVPGLPPGLTICTGERARLCRHVGQSNAWAALPVNCSCHSLGALNTLSPNPSITAAAGTRELGLVKDALACLNGSGQPPPGRLQFALTAVRSSVPHPVREPFSPGRDVPVGALLGRLARKAASARCATASAGKAGSRQQ